MEYKPLCRERDGIRVISIEPSKAYSSGRGTENLWTPSITLWGVNCILVPSVRIALAEDLVHCRLEHVSLHDTVDSDSSNVVGSTKPGAIEVPAWRLQKDIEPYLDGPLGSDSVRDPQTADKLAPRFLWGDFEALSYTWGEENADGRVVVNGKLCHVHQNLEAALRRLRALPETEHGMKYWIDALCINQKDIPERNAEVKRMHEICEREWSIVVWLGETTEDHRTACDCISGIGHLARRKYKTEHTPYSEALYGHESLKWKPLMDLLGQPYWKRVWVIQELAMNHHNTIFICGDSIFFREELKRTLEICIRRSLLIQQWLDAESDHSAKENQENLFGFFRRVSGLVELNLHGFHRPSLEDVLSLAQEASSKDIRDKIYGVHGLLPTDLSSRIQPHYDSSVGEIFQDFSEKLLHECGLGGVLSWGGSGLGLPSWCVDLSRPLSRCHMQWLRRKRANLNRKFSCNLTYRLCDTTKYLWCNGVFIDTIGSATACSLRMSDLTRNLGVQQDSDDLHGDYPMVEDEALIKKLVETLFLGNPDRSGYQVSFLAVPWIEHSRDDDFDLPFRGLEAREEFWRIVKDDGYVGAFDKFRKANRTFKIQGHELKYFFPHWMPRTDATYKFSDEDMYLLLNWQMQVESLQKDIRFAVISLVGRALANTTKGHLAMVPSEARKDDVIAIVDCPFPIVLRPKGQGYEYIGECYLHGFMDGEAFEGDEPPKVEEFVIV